MKTLLGGFWVLTLLWLRTDVPAQDSKKVAPIVHAPAPACFTDNRQSLGSGDSWYIQLVDINADGLLEAYFEGAIWQNDGHAHFTKTGQSFGSADRPAYFADFNGDGFVDVVCDNVLFLNDGHGHFSERRNLPTHIPMYSSHLADLTGRGHVDIIVAGQAEDRVLLNDGKGNFTETGKGLGGWGQCTYAAGDINGDGIPDVYVGIPHTPPPDMVPMNDKLWLGDGKGGFSEAPLNIRTRATRGVVLADFNGDGRMDLFLTSQIGESKVYFNDGRGNFTDSGQLLGAAPGGAALAADFNNDGFLDVFVARGGPTDNGVPNLIWLNDGTGHFADSGLRLGHSNSIAAAVGDLNGDGKPDLFVANVKNVVTKTGPGFNEVWLNCGSAAVEPSPPPSGSPTPRRPHLGQKSPG